MSGVACYSVDPNSDRPATSVRKGLFEDGLYLLGVCYAIFDDRVVSVFFVVDLDVSG